MTLNFEQLQVVWNLHKKLDDLLEGLAFNPKDMKTTLTKIYEFLVEEIGIAAFFVETMNEKLVNTLYTFGLCDESIKLRAPVLTSANKTVSFTANGGLWFAQPIDVDNHIIGTIAIGFKQYLWDEKTCFEYHSEVLNCVSELLDSFFYGIHCSSMKHSMIMGLQEALADQDILNCLNKANGILARSVKYKHMLIVYTDKELVTTSKNIRYVYYDEEKAIYDSSEKPLSVLDRAIRSEKDFLMISSEELARVFDCKNFCITHLTKNMGEESVGFIAIEMEEGTQLSQLSKELLQVFSEELKKRLVDLNREKNLLRKYFSNPVISRLITSGNYEERFLKAREAEIGVIFADISGFTKMSEQILKSPDRITNFVNKWARGVVARTFPLGATLDKLIGDCVMLLFGPPFYEASREEIVRHMIQASTQIRSYTQSFLRLKENEDIRQHPDFEKFGVSIGVNFCHCVVGLIGPNEDLTAFSSGVNITARLQGLASTNQILVTESVRDIAVDSKLPWIFSEKKATMVKNVEKPLGYYQLLG